MSDAPDSSGISFTAYYTGQVWQKHGLAPAFLGTRNGRLLYRAGRPVELLSELAMGSSNEILLLQRHLILDHLLTHAIERDGYAQVVELACGLSPRGLRFKQRYGDRIRYIEADLPAMATRKRDMLTAVAESERPEVIACDILQHDSDISLSRLFAGLDHSKPVIVITEGLINYFDLETISGFWRELANQFSHFPAGRYLSDLYPGYQWHRAVKLINGLKGLLAIATRSSVTLHFSTESELIAHFRECGFSTCTVHMPERWYGELDIPVQRVPSFVRVLEINR